MPNIHNPWKNEEIELLINNFSNRNLSKNEILKLFPNRSFSSLMHKASRLGINRSKIHPIPNDNDFEELYFSKDAEELKRIYNVGYHSINKWARKFGLKRKTFSRLDIPCDISFTNKQKEILNGKLLGDGCINKKNGNKNCQFYIGQCGAQTEYVEKLVDEFSLFFHKINTKESDGVINLENGSIIPDKVNKNIITNSYSIAHPLFTELERKWYLRDENGEYILKSVGNKGRMDRIKIVPPDLELTPLTIAIWFFDDGNNSYKDRRALFCTNSFTKEECEFLIDLLKNMGFKNCALSKCGNDGQFIIAISRSSYLDFMEMIEQYNKYDCFQYKTNTHMSEEEKTKYRLGLVKHNTSGTRNLCFCKNKKEWKVSILINGQHLSLGFYKEDDKQIAEEVANIANKMKENGINDKSKFFELRRKYALKMKDNNNSSGCIGVSNAKESLRYRSRITVNKMEISLGQYVNKEDAIKIRKQAENLFDNGIYNKEEYMKLKEELKKSLQKV